MEKKYLKVKDYILDKIERGEYIMDSPITSERDLADILKVNRMTVRRAIEELMYDGILIRKKGSGTFLNACKMTKNILDKNISDDKIKNIKVLSYKLGMENQYGLKVLKTEKEYIRLRRVRTFGNVPYAYEDIYIHSDFTDSISVADYNLGLKKLVKKYSASEDIYINQRVEAILCLKNTANILKIKTGSPILQIKTDFIKASKVVVHCRSYHPGESYMYEAGLSSLK